ncbi:MAG: hypothetical protein OXP69_02930 [Spirochaetaceae bacterium]|nr:hypothetical protein [Spirochaetaceae bacterium]
MANSEQERRIARVIEEYDLQGWHRSGTEVDAASARWLADRVAGCGLEPTLERVPFDRFDPGPAYVQTGGRRVAGVPLFDGGLTGPEGVSGSLGTLGSGAAIGVTELGALSTPRYREARRAGAHDTIVAVTPSGPGVALMNAVHFFEPFGPPVLQVGSEARPHLAEQVRRGGHARVVVSASRQPADTCNVTASIPGQDPRLPPVVVMTPRSGWWHCAGERGGGIACWLEVMRAMAGFVPARDVLFVSTTGHEIGLPGIEAFLKARPSVLTDARLWVHFGANIGATPHAGPLYAATGDELRDAAREALAEAGAKSAEPADAMVGAESSFIAARGARCVAMVGGRYDLFHREADRWPASIDPEAIARCAIGFARIAMDTASE